MCSKQAIFRGIMIVSQLAKNIQFLRKRVRLSQQALANELNLTRSNIASYENGKAEPRATKLVNIAKYFQIGLSQLIELDLQSLSEESLEEVWIGSEINYTPFLKSRQQLFDDFLERSSDLNKILNGFRIFYKYKIQHLKETESDALYLLHNFENLLGVMDSLQQFNQELIDLVVQIKAEQ